jgi:hypothetical protein
MVWFEIGAAVGLVVGAGGMLALAIKVPGVFGWIARQVEARIARK